MITCIVVLGLLVLVLSGLILVFMARERRAAFDLAQRLQDKDRAAFNRRSQLFRRLDWLRDHEESHPDGVYVSPESDRHGRDVVCRILDACPTLPVPGLFTTSSGALQAEWVLGHWAVDVEFDGTEVHFEATNTRTGDEVAGDLTWS